MALQECKLMTDPQKKELQRYRNEAFPIACYQDDFSLITVPWHWHDEWEILMVDRGTTVVLLENAQISVPAGDGLFINAKALHAIDSQLSGDSVLRSAVFHPRLVGGGAESIYWEKWVLPLSREEAPEYTVLRRVDPLGKLLLEYFEKAWQAAVYEAEDYENEVRYLLSKVAAGLCKDCVPLSEGRSAQGRLDAERIRVMLRFIQEHLAQPMQTRQIAESANISDSVCLRCFHRMLGITPMQYVIQCRLQRAAELLRTRHKMSAKEIAFECGFQDISYFTKAFREKMGVTPIEYRNKS